MVRAVLVERDFVGISEGPCTRDPPLVSGPYQGGDVISHSNVEPLKIRYVFTMPIACSRREQWTAHDQVALTTYRSFPMASHSPDRYPRI